MWTIYFDMLWFFLFPSEELTFDKAIDRFNMDVIVINTDKPSFIRVCDYCSADALF